MRLAWLSDIHLNFLNTHGRDVFYSELLKSGCDRILLTGDIGEAPTVARFLKEMDNVLARPVHFVLGNHDFYHGSVECVRREVESLCSRSDFLRWMPRAGSVSLSPSVALVGHDGWADGRYGDFFGSNLALNDYICIQELRTAIKEERLERMQSLASEAADHMRRVIPPAFREHRHIILLTHVPPFREACWHRGRPSDEGSLPHFASKVAGDLLRGILEARRDLSMTVLCGHTHSPSRAAILPNLKARAAKAQYGAPQIQGILEVTEEGTPRWVKEEGAVKTSHLE